MVNSFTKLTLKHDNQPDIIMEIMTIQSEKNGSSLILYVSGRLDTNSAPLLDKKLKQRDETNELILDLTELSYISSQGLRVLFQTQKEMNGQGGKLLFRNIKNDIREIFEISGFFNLMDQDKNTLA